MGLSMSAALPKETRCLSPSDFGFHNALLEATGKLRFVDFEYAGWDDPAKTGVRLFLPARRAGAGPILGHVSGCSDGLTIRIRPEMRARGVAIACLSHQVGNHHAQ